MVQGVKPRVYLAGPISGCNDAQRHAWRDELKRGFGSEFEFIDPTDNLIGEDQSDYEVVHADIEAIRSADVVLANMWRESIGTAFGILHAHDAAKLVVVCDPNLLESRMMAFYADAVKKSVPAALHAIRVFLDVQQKVRAVLKSNGSEEPFDRQKLLNSIRKACIDAGQSDLGPPRAILTEALGNLLENLESERTFTTEEIRDAVWNAIAELAADPMHEADYESIRRAWEQFDSGVAAQPSSTAIRIPITVHEQPLEVKIRTNGTHSTIWGNGVGPRATAIFEDMMKVDGITEIILGPFRNTGQPPSRPHVRIQASKTAHVIEGKCYDNGKKGTLQTFQVRVADPLQRDEILVVMRDFLVNRGWVKGTVEA